MILQETKAASGTIHNFFCLFHCMVPDKEPHTQYNCVMLQSLPETTNHEYGKFHYLSHRTFSPYSIGQMWELLFQDLRWARLNHLYLFTPAY